MLLTSTVVSQPRQQQNEGHHTCHLISGQLKGRTFHNDVLLAGGHEGEEDEYKAKERIRNKCQTPYQWPKQRRGASCENRQINTLHSFTEPNQTMP
jgi:hypothetical protein